jgi:hypothetical protein
LLPPFEGSYQFIAINNRNEALFDIVVYQGDPILNLECEKFTVTTDIDKQKVTTKPPSVWIE